MAVIVTIFAAKMVLGNTDPSKWRYSYLAKVTEPTEVKRGLCRYSVDAWGYTAPQSGEKARSAEARKCLECSCTFHQDDCSGM